MNRFSAHAALAMAALVAFVSAAAPARAEDYRLGVQDRVRVHVSEWPALTGEVTVGADGEVTLPVIGRVPAAKLNTAELAAAIARRLQEKAKLPQPPDTAVDIAAYRPFYILGNVQSPGEYPYRPGMLVLNAVSIAGGVYRSERGSQWDIDRVAISSRGELAVLTLRRFDLQAERIRLDAELDDAQAFPSTPANADEPLKRALVEQRRLFEADLERRRSQKALIESSISSGEQEISSINRQLVDGGQKVAATEAELEQVRKLAKADLAVHRLFPLERALADAKREQQDLEISRLRAEQRIHDLRRSLIDMDEQRRNGALAGIQRANAQMREVDERHDGLVRLLDGAAHHASEASEAARASEAPQLRFTIVRMDGDKPQEIEANETTRVRPGDIVKVTRTPEARQRGAVTEGGAGAINYADLPRPDVKGR